MDIKKSFKILTNFFHQHHYDYAVIGAFALYAYGYTRATRDIDFITKLEYQPKIIEYLESLHFKTLHCSKGFSNHLNSTRVRIDFVYIDDETANMIFQAARKKIILRNLELPVVSPEHLIALKLFAIYNDPDRKYKEFADINALLQYTTVDKTVIENYFKKYNLENYYDEFIKK